MATVRTGPTVRTHARTLCAAGALQCRIKFPPIKSPAMRLFIKILRPFVMAALCNRGPLYFCPVVSIYLDLSIDLSIYLSIDLLLFSSPNLSGHR